MIQPTSFRGYATPAVAGAFLRATGVRVSGQGGGQPFEPHPSTQEPVRLVTLHKLMQSEKELSNWGRRGKGDHRGPAAMWSVTRVKPDKASSFKGICRAIWEFATDKTVQS
jgi:hypothetical protein